MPPREWKLRITDILDAISKITEYTRGMDLAAFEGDKKTTDAVSRNFGIIGEAAANVPPAITDVHSEIPWQHMRRMRNFVVHVYFGVDAQTVWEAIQNDLPPLVPLLEKMLSDNC